MGERPEYLMSNDFLIEGDCNDILEALCNALEKTETR